MLKQKLIVFAQAIQQSSIDWLLFLLLSKAVSSFTFPKKVKSYFHFLKAQFLFKTAPFLYSNLSTIFKRRKPCLF